MSDPEPTQDATGIVTKRSPRSVTETVSRFTELLDSSGATLFALIDQSAKEAERSQPPIPTGESAPGPGCACIVPAVTSSLQ